jgi:uncharacterized membrane protein (UPF0127 family)
MKTQKIKFKTREKEFIVEAKVCDNFWSKLSGLMFRRKSLPLLFVFKNHGMYAIHSWFCKKFLAVWLDDQGVVDIKLVRPWRSYVVPKMEFNKLLEVIIDDKNSFFER